MLINTVTVSGKISVAPQMKQWGPVTAYVFRIKEDWKTKWEGVEKDNTFEIECQMFGDKGSECAYLLKLDMPVVITGRLKLSSYKDKKTMQDVKNYVISVSGIMAPSASLKRPESDNELPF